MAVQGIGAYIRTRIADGLSNQEILQEVIERFPGCQTTINSIRWYRSPRNQDGGRVRSHQGTSPEARAARPPPPSDEVPTSIPEFHVVDGAELRAGDHGYYHVAGVRTFRPQGGMGKGSRGSARGRGFNCDLLVAGVKVASVVEPGTGQPATYHWLDEGAPTVRAAVVQWDGGLAPVEATPLQAGWLEHVGKLPKVMEREHPGETVHVSPDRHLGRLVDDFLVERHLRAEMFEHVLFVVGSGELMRLPLRGTTIAKVRRTVERDYPSARILNDMPMAEAIRLVP